MVFVLGILFLILAANYRNTLASEEPHKGFLVDNFFISLPNDPNTQPLTSYSENEKRLCITRFMVFRKIGFTLLFLYFLYITGKLILWATKIAKAKHFYKQITKGGHMGRWLKANWFKAGILASFLIVSFSIAYYFVFFLPGQQISSTKSLPKSAVEVVELENRCFEAANEFFKENGFDPKNSGFRNHYNKKLNKCFIDIKSAKVDNEGRLSFHRAIYDVYNRKMYGEYLWKPEKDKNYWEVKPTACLMLDKSCNAIEEYEGFVKEYMEE